MLHIFFVQLVSKPLDDLGSPFLYLSINKTPCLRCHKLDYTQYYKYRHPIDLYKGIFILDILVTVPLPVMVNRRM